MLRALPFLLAWFAAGCQAATDSNQCRLDGEVVCPGNFVGYSCQSASQPGPNCSAGTLEPDGETGYCCAVDSCPLDSTTAGCAGSSD